MARVAAVVVNWNGANDTIACMRSLQAATTGGAKLSVVVVDNASADGSFQKFMAFVEAGGFDALPLTIPRSLTGKVRNAMRFARPDRPDFTILLAAAFENNGFAGGNNIGVELSRAIDAPEFVWFLNSDTEVEREALTALLKKMARHPDIGMCGSALVHASDRQTVQSYGGSFYSMRTGRAWSPGAGQAYSALVSDEWAEERINYVAGAAMLVRTELLDRIGMMSEDYFLYNEEIDLACRAVGHGRLGVATKSIVYHHVGASIGTEGASGGASRLSTFYQTRSKLIFAARYSRRYYPLVWLTLLARAIKFLRSSARRAEAKVIFGVLAGRRAVDQRWFSERRREGSRAEQCEIMK